VGYRPLSEREEVLDLPLHGEVQRQVQRLDLIEIPVEGSNRIADLEQRDRQGARVRAYSSKAAVLPAVAALASSSASRNASVMPCAVSGSLK